MKRFLPPMNLLRKFGSGNEDPSKYYDDGVMYKGVALSKQEIVRAEEFIIDSPIINENCTVWRWWEVQVVLDEACRRRIIGWGEDE